MTAKKLDSNLTRREHTVAINEAHKHCSWLGGKAPARIQPVPEKRITAPRKPRTEPSEAEILRAILQYLRLRTDKVSKVWRQNSGVIKMHYNGKDRYINMNSAKGMSDIMGVLKDGRVLSIEVKSRTGVVMAHQQAFLDSIKSAGGVAFVARSVADVEAALK